MTEEKHDIRSVAAAAARISTYLERRRKARGIDIEDIHAFDASPDGGVYLRASDLETLASAMASGSPAAGTDSVAVPREVIGDMFRFLHQAWTGTGSVTEEGSHGKDLRDWRDTMSFYHRQNAIEGTNENGSR